MIDLGLFISKNRYTKSWKGSRFFFFFLRNLSRFLGKFREIYLLFTRLCNYNNNKKKHFNNNIFTVVFLMKKYFLKINKNLVERMKVCVHKSVFA